MTTASIDYQHLLGHLPVDPDYVGRHRLARPSRRARIRRGFAYVRTSLRPGAPFASSDVFMERVVVAVIAVLTLVTAAIGAAA